MATYIYRDFNRKKVSNTDGSYTTIASEGYKGGISVHLMRDHCVEIMVEGLHENGSAYFPMDYPCGQSFMRVQVDPMVDVYRAILAILDKITADHHYTLHRGGYIHKDFVLCSDQLVQEHSELCNEDMDDGTGSHMGGHWMEFTLESLSYLDIWEDNEVRQESEGILLHGNVVVDQENPVFTYDYPIISSGMGHDYYRLTRGKCVWEVKYEDVYPENI